MEMLQQLNMFGPPETLNQEAAARPRRADDRPAPSERELIWPSDLAEELGSELLERLYGDIPRRTRLRVDEVCRRLRCSDEHVRHLIEAGSLAAVDISVPNASVPYWRVYRYSLVRWLFRREFGPQAESPRGDLTRADQERCMEFASTL
jgi:hypothetical protein